MTHVADTLPAHALPEFTRNWLDRTRLEIHQAQALAAAILTTAEPVHVSKLPGDPVALRGIPVVGRSAAAGAIRETQPEMETIRRSER